MNDKYCVRVGGGAGRVCFCFLGGSRQEAGKFSQVSTIAPLHARYSMDRIFQKFHQLFIVERRRAIGGVKILKNLIFST